MNDKFDNHLNSTEQQIIQTKTKHRQSIPLWFSQQTSHLLKRLTTHRSLFQSKTSSYCKNELQEIEQGILESSATDRLDYQNKQRIRELVNS